MDKKEKNPSGVATEFPLPAQERIDRTCLSYWFPKLQSAGLPVPRTELVEMPAEAFRDVFRVFDGESMQGDALPFFSAIKEAADGMGYPCFLRTGQTSGKHSWQDTCFLPSAEVIPQHVVNIVEFSECVHLVGLPCDVWAVREFLPTKPLGVCPRYGNMPLCREFRFFVADGEVQCWHPYWPLKALERGGADASLYEPLSSFSRDEYLAMFELVVKVTKVIKGAWSVDVLETERGWYVTDMAEAHKSYHEEGCDALATLNAPARETGTTTQD